jgi:hypothetical protein
MLEKALNTKLASVKTALLRTFGALALLWMLTCGALFEGMRQPPETFARFMTRVPAPIAFVVLPFETLWTQARAGSLQVGDLAPDFSLMKLDKRSQIRFSGFCGATAASGSRIRKLHLTSLPAGGSRPQPPLPAIRKSGRVSGRLHYGSASQ